MGKLLAISRAVIMALSMVIYMMLYSVKRIFVKHSPEQAFRLRRAWMKIGNPIMGNQVTISGRQLDEPAIYMSNHRSFSDPLVQANAFDAFIIAKAEVASIPVMHQAAQLTGIIYVKRESVKSRKATLDTLVETIKNGYNVLIYPEGTTGDQPLTKKFKFGAFKSAALNDFPIVPVAIEYSKQKDLWINRTLIAHFLQQYAKWKTEVKISVGPALRSSDPQELLDQTQAWINKELTRLQTDWQELKA